MLPFFNWCFWLLVVFPFATTFGFSFEFLAVLILTSLDFLWTALSPFDDAFEIFFFLFAMERSCTGRSRRWTAPFFCDDASRFFHCCCVIESWCFLKRDDSFPDSKQNWWTNLKNHWLLFEKKQGNSGRWQKCYVTIW